MQTTALWLHTREDTEDTTLTAENSATPTATATPTGRGSIICRREIGCGVLERNGSVEYVHHVGGTLINAKRGCPPSYM